MKKKIVAITLDPELHDFMKKFSKMRKKTVSGLISEHIFDLSASAVEERREKYRAGKE